MGRKNAGTDRLKPCRCAPIFSPHADGPTGHASARQQVLFANHVTWQDIPELKKRALYIVALQWWEAVELDSAIARCIGAR